MLGSKRPSLRPSAAVSRSPPARRRGSKRHAGPHPRDPPRSPPARRRGSKHGRGGGGGRHSPSPPARRRGLNQRPDRVDDHAAGVADLVEGPCFFATARGGGKTVGEGKRWSVRVS